MDDPEIAIVVLCRQQFKNLNDPRNDLLRSFGGFGWAGCCPRQNPVKPSKMKSCCPCLLYLEGMKAETCSGQAGQLAGVATRFSMR